MESARRICQAAKDFDWDGEGWSPSVIVGHVVDVDKEVWMARFTLMRAATLAGDAPPKLSWWEPNAEETRQKYDSVLLDDSIEILLNSRKGMVEFLRSISISDRRAPALHDTFGIVTIESLLPYILNHDEEHRLSLI